MSEQERRAPGVRRVPVETVVEICGRDSSVPGFEAESIELSGRGMHLRTDYLPDVGAPLVMRFESDGQEVIVEGEVAWQKPAGEGGNFGIKFTALDSNSVQVLKRLCGPREAAPEEREAPSPRSASEPEEFAAASAPEPGPTQLSVATGSKVKLHIHGLGAPMKARVCKTGKHRIDVGSSLGFLQVGRPLELEDVEAAERCPAEIDSVAVTVDPQTQVPELVVTLKYQGAPDATPEPSTVDAPDPFDDEPRPELVAPPELPRTFSAHGYVDAPDDISEEDRDALAERLEQLAHGLGRMVKRTGSRLFSASGQAAGSLGDAAGGLKNRFQQQGQRNAPRRKTAAPPRQTSGSRYALRPQAGTGRPQRPTQGSLRSQQGSGGAPAQAGAKSAKSAKRRMALGGGAIAMLCAGAYFAFGAPPAPGLSRTTPVAPLTEVAQLETGVSEVAPTPEPGAAAQAGPATAAPAPDKGRAEAAPSKTSGGIVADVPLFGKRSLTTEQPAPLGETEVAAEAESAANSGDLAEFGVGDETFSEKPSQAGSAAKVDVEPPKPKQVAPWGSGRLHLPIIHRIKLDAPGGAIQGTQTATGFQVVIPERKALESGRAIEKRDDRIVAVKIDNSSQGAKVTFKFRKTIPAYKVRFKGDYVEFFISSPEK